MTELVKNYTKAYKNVHGVKPKAFDLFDWTEAELSAGIRVLKTLGG